MRTFYFLGAAGLLGIALASGVSACMPHAEATETESVGRFPTTHPFRTNTEISREYVAQIRAIQHIEVRAMERGYVQDVLIDEGKTVHQGQPMFQLMRTVYQAELEQAAAEAEYAQIEYDNTRTLREGNVVSEAELKLAKAKRDKANAERSLAQAHFNLAQFNAPFDGIMGRLEVRKGSLVEEGDLLTTLADNHEMWVYFNVSETEYLNYRKRMAQQDPLTVKLRLASGDVFDQDGSVQTIEADFNNETGNIAFRATFPNPDGLLRHGETGNVIVSTPLDDVLIIPQKATFDVLDKKYVFVVDKDGIARTREITVKEEMPHLYVIGSGLTDGDQFLLDGLRKVRDGQEVETEAQDPEAVFKTLPVPAE
ncbi:MAG TPA: efflux RND transporter periplasmic adaptor subunit [Myxococcota bacterium]|nr:efflux RND transporter periplasmic adaptor subunit [Myxococcota bacterium]